MTTSWVDALRNLFRRTTCIKLVRYAARKIEFTGLAGEVSGAKFSLGDFSLETKKIESASEMAKTLDDYQYLTCQLSRELPKQDPDWKVLLKLRSTAISLITMARIVFEAFKLDPKNQADNLETLVQRMEHFVNNVVSKATEERVGFVPMPGQGLTGIGMEPIHYALQFAGVNEIELDRMIASL